MTQLDEARVMLSNLLGVQPAETTDWNQVRSLLEQGQSVIVEFDEPGATGGDRLLWTLRELEGGQVMYHDPAQDPVDLTAGRVLVEGGLPRRTIVGDGHLRMDVQDLGNLFSRGHGRAIVPGEPAGQN